MMMKHTLSIVWVGFAAALFGCAVDEQNPTPDEDSNHVEIPLDEANAEVQYAPIWVCTCSSGGSASGCNVDEAWSGVQPCQGTTNCNPCTTPVCQEAAEITCGGPWV